MPEKQNESMIFPKGDKADGQVFTGEAYVNMLVPDKDGVYGCMSYDVLFMPGSRNNWHIYAGGQILLCTDGIGFYQEK